MRRRRFLFLLLLDLTTAVWVHAQTISYIGIENGLSNNTVTSIYKDKFGLMWFGTLDGINRYDGTSFKIFRKKISDSTSLPNDIITSINADNSGNIWVGTQKGLGVLDNRTLEFSSITYTGTDGIIQPFDQTVNGVVNDGRGNMLVAANNVGLLLSNNGTRNLLQVPLTGHLERHAYHYTVEAISALLNAKIWLAIDGDGLAFYDTKTGRLNMIGKVVQSVTCLTPDKAGNLWIGTKHGLFYYNASSRSLGVFDLKEQGLNKANISNILLKRNGHLWVATNGEGMVEIEATLYAGYHILRPFRPGALSSDALFTVFEDEQARKWIGTLRGGIQVVDENKNKFMTYVHNPNNSNSLINNFTFSFCEDGRHNVWIGTDGGGLSVWDRKTNTFRNYPYVSTQLNVGSRISSIIRDQKDRIWTAAYDGGINRYDPASRTFTKIPFQNINADHSIWRLYEDNTGGIWSLCLRGPGVDHPGRIFKYNPVLNAFGPAPFDIQEDAITVIDDDKDNFWMGGFSGLIHVNKITGPDKFIDLKAIVRSLHKSRSGLLWIGTYGSGLLSFDRAKDRFTNYTEETGLCNNKVLNIEEDKRGNIWVSTYNGISKLTPSSGKIENFYAVDGLQSNQFYYNASAHLSTGELIFGGIKGFNIFNPDSIRPVHDFPPLIISGLRIANTEVSANSEYFPNAGDVYTIKRVVLPYDKAILSIDFVALEYSLPAKIQYSYFLQGKDKSWNNIGNQHNINYSQLNDGDYVLKIRATNASGFWNPRETSILITVFPPWYRTWWAYLLYLSAVVASVYGYLYYHSEQTRLHYEVKLVTELNEKKIAFFTNISHELRTPLTLIVNPIKDLLHSNGANLDLIDISAVYRNSRRLLSLVDQLLLFRSSENEIADLQPSVMNLNDVCQEVFLCFNNQVHAKNLKYQFKPGSAEIQIYADREKLEIVLFNLLSNAIKYTPKGGSIEVELVESHNGIEILVTDSGPGIPQEAGKKLFDKFYRLPKDKESASQSGFGIGLFLAKRYIDIHNGELSFTSKLGEGTTFRIRLPKTSIPVQSPADIPVIQAEDQSRALLHELIADTEMNNSENNSRQHVDEILGGITNKKDVIMLIDDDSEMRAYIKNLLGNAYLVYEAENAETGFDKVLEFEPDIILCDVVMGGMSGVEFCSKLKESPSFSHIPVILLTGTSSPEVKLKGIECGADDYITKPFESELLLARIKSMLKGRNTLKDYFFNEITLKNNGLKIPSEYSDFLSKCIAIIEGHLEDEGFSLKTFTDEIGMSRSNLSRKIKSISGLSTSEFIRYIRLRKAAQLMIQTDMQIKEIAFRIGFQDIKYFREQFYKLFEMNPSDFIRKYRKAFIPSLNLNMAISSQKNKN